MITVERLADPDSARPELSRLLAGAAAADGHEALGEAKTTGLAEADGLTLVARAGEELAGWAQGRWNERGVTPRLTAEYAVAPDHRGDGVEADLLAGIEAELSAAGGGTLYVWRHHVDDPAGEAPVRRGYTTQRELAIMGRPLEGAATATPPPGVAIRPFRPDADDEAVVAVNNAAFAGHPEQGGWTVEDLARKRRLPWFDPAGFLLAWAGDRLVGFHWTKEHGEEDSGLGLPTPHGEVYVLGLHPDAQGRGIARALLDAGLTHLAARGCASVLLYVDRANDAAVRLYERGGFATLAVEVCYELEVGSSPGAGSGTSL